MKRSRLPIHALLFSIYPVLYLYSRNTIFIPIEETWRALGMCAALGTFLLFAFRSILNNWGKAGMLTSLVMLMLLTFGHFANIFPLSTGILAWGWLAIFLLLSFAVIRTRQFGSTTLFLNIAALALIAIPLWETASTQISVYALDKTKGQAALTEIRGEVEAESSMRLMAREQMPDIYYIVLDSYERADILKARYGLDNSSFLKELTDRGFYVAGSSRSNFLNTTYSLNTAMNLVYFNDMPRSVMLNAKTNLQTNYVTDFLRMRGYKIVVHDSGTGDSNNQYADIFVTPNPHSQGSRKVQDLNSFEKLLLRTTMGAILLGTDSDQQVNENALTVSANKELNLRRERVTHAFSHLPDNAGSDGPYFHFAHIYLPHKPFLYGPEGEPLSYQPGTGLYWYEPSPENYIEQYRHQIAYVNQAVLRAIDAIQHRSKKPVAIILQSDHGDDFFLDWEDPTNQGVEIRSATLNAVYFSDGGYEDLYPSITTVNTFRVVFNHWFDTSYPMLPDRIYFHIHPLMASPSALPKFIDACEKFQVCSPQPPAAQSAP